MAAAAANKATSIALVGSVARGDDADFLATFEEGSCLVDLARLQGALERLLGSDVDVVSVGGLKPDRYAGHRAMLAEAITLRSRRGPAAMPTGSATSKRRPPSSR